MFQWNLWGFLTLFAVVLCWALAVLLLRVGSPGSVSRQLSLLLVVEGVTLWTSGIGYELLSAPDEFFEKFPAIASINDTLHYVGDSAMLALYPAFLAVSLHTKLTRPFARKGSRIAMAVIGLLIFIAVISTPRTVGTTVLFVMLTLLFGFALVASINAWYVAKPGIARDRARSFTFAFGFRDVFWSVMYGTGIWRIAVGIYETEDDWYWTYQIYILGTLCYIPLIAYGILRTQLFDIDLRIRWTIRQSTLAAAVVSIMFILSEGADRLLSAELGDGVGLFAAAAVLFFLAPLQRFAERVAKAAMPNTQNTPEYAAFRKMQVYEAAFTEAQQESGISHKERALLTRLRDSLDISETDAKAIESELEMGHPA
jgi:hypothetical protein